MIEINKEAIAHRFMRYAQIDTQSDPQSGQHPSTEKQKNLSKILVEELKQMGIANAEMDTTVMCMRQYLPIREKTMCR